MQNIDNNIKNIKNINRTLRTLRILRTCRILIIKGSGKKQMHYLSRCHNKMMIVVVLLIKLFEC